MIELCIAILWLLTGLVILVGIGYVVLWTLGQIGVQVPPMVVKIVLIVITLLVLIYALTLVAGSGSFALPGSVYGGTHHVEYFPQTLPQIVADYKMAA
jgi:hypothetical protein